MRLETERLVLRELEKKDLPELVRLANNLNVSRYLETMPFPYEHSDGVGFMFKSILSSGLIPRWDYDFAIEFEEVFTGIVSLVNVNRFYETATMGYWLGEEFWRKGIMFEAASEVVRFAFEDLDLRRINIEAATENVASNSLIRKLGFNYEGMRRQYKKTRSTGERVDANVYGMLREC